MSGFFDKLAKWFFFGSLAIALLGGAFLYGVIAHRDDRPPVPQLRSALHEYREIFAPHPRSEHLQPNRGQGSGVTVNNTAEDGALIALAGFFDEENQIRLIERDGTVVRKWSLDYFEHFPDEATRPCARHSPLLVDTHGLHLTPGGKVLLNYEYCGTVQLDACGAVDWTLEHPTHHSLVPAERGGFWILGRDFWHSREDRDRFPPFSQYWPAREMDEDLILRVNETGDILEKISLPQMLWDNGMEAILTAKNGHFRGLQRENRELVHSNKIAELPSDIADAFPLFEAGDLAISLRGLNLVFVLDPDTRTIKWHQTGPWLRQHDPEFRPDGRISIFNNNVYITAYRDEQTDLDTPFQTNIMVIDPVTRQTEVVFGEQPGEEMLSVIRGQHELLEDGSMLITEFDAGRILEVDKNRQIVWEYVNEYDENFVGELSNANLYPAGYFEQPWAACD